MMPIAWDAALQAASEADGFWEGSLLEFMKPKSMQEVQNGS